MFFQTWSKNKKTLALCLLGFVVFLCIFVFFPLRIFQAEATSISGQYTSHAEISMGDWLGITDAGKKYIFRLTKKGYVLAIIILLGMPALLGYSYWVKQTNKEKENEH